MSKRNLLIFSALALFLLPTFVYAVNIPGWPLVPCGLSQDNPATTIVESKPCGRCDLFQLLKNLIDFVSYGLMPPLAVLFFVWAGFLILLSGANPGLYAQGQTIFKNTFYGIIILLLAWMITNTLILSIGASYNNASNWWEFTCTEPAPVSPPVVFGITTTSLPGATVGQPYNQTIQITGGTQPLAWTQLGSLPAGLSFNAANGAISGTPTTAGTSTFTIRAADSSSPPKLSEKRLSITVGDVLPTLKYGCNAQNQCAQDPNGQYTSPLCNDACSTPPGNLTITTASFPNATQNQPYSQTLSVTGGVAPYFWSVSAGSLPTGLNFSFGVISGTPTATGISTFTVMVLDNSTPPKSATKQLTITVNSRQGAACLQSGLNLCQGQQTSCSASSCSQYIPAINQYASRTGISNGTNLLKAIMFNESSCIADRVSFDGSSFGLMQFQPATANIYKSRCGITENIDRAWLTNSANADASICLAAEYIRAISQSQCGSSVRNIAAGYNGGQSGNTSACASSSDCAGETSCDGSSVKRWECLYDNPQHTVCNGGSDPLAGYNETRNYATKVLYCYNNPGF